MHEPTVSVVVPTYSRAEPLRDCLAALSRQTMPAETFEVVVVDDGSPVPVACSADAFRPGPAVRVIRQENAGPAAARNRGVEEARGTLVAFTDDDCLPAPRWLESLVAAQRRFPDALVGGTTVNGLANDIFATSSQLIIDLVYEHFNARSESAYFLASNNILCGRAHYRDLGGFDTAFPRAGAEDRDFCDRWRTSGRPLRLVTDAVIEHRHAQNLFQYLSLHYRYGRGAYLYQRRRKLRGSGTMADDLGFHRSLPARMSRHIGRQRGLGRRARIAAAILLWQAANAAGFLHEAAVQLSAPPRPASPPARG